MRFLEIAQQVFNLEKQALTGLQNKLDPQFEQVVQALLTCKGRVIVCGMGKSGLIGKKIAATFASIGQPAFFLHPSEAIHGDLGMLMKEDVFMSISNSGETDELLQLLVHIKNLELPHISLLGNTDSTLARHANWVLDVGVEVEASPLAAVPLASSLTTLAMGDALAAALIHARNFQQEDFLRFHPGGSLGRKLLTTVEQQMRQQDLPVVHPNLPVQEVLLKMSAGKLGLAVVCQPNNKVIGIITDGDLRRALQQHAGPDFFQLQAQDIMTSTPQTIEPEASLLNAEELMNQYKISALLILHNGMLQGIIAKQHIR